MHLAIPILVGLAPHAHAQAVAPSQIVPHFPVESTVPKSEDHAASPVPLSGSPSGAPAGAEALEVQPGSVLIEGGFEDLASAHGRVIDALAGKRVTLARIYDVAAALEADYARAGYVLVRVVMPQQRIENGGPVRLLVVDGHIEAVDASQVPSAVRGRVVAMLSALVDRPHVRMADVERKMELAGGLPGVRLRSALSRGQSRGGVLLIVNGTFEPVTAQASIDNNLPGSLGRWLLTANLGLNSPTGNGEEIHVLGGQQADLQQFGFAQSRFALVGAGGSVPLGDDGLRLSLDYLQARSQVAPAAGVPGSRGRYVREGVRIDYDAWLTHRQQLHFSAGLDRIIQTSQLPQFAVTLSRDDYLALRLGASWSAALGSRGGLDGQLRFSQGLGNAASPGPGEIPFSRQFAREDFSRIEARISWKRPIARAVTLAMVARGQGAFGQSQFLSEQFALADMTALSGLVPGGANVDYGATLRGELGYQLTSPGKAGSFRAAPYLFGAGGWGGLHHATRAEAGTKSAQSLGLGLRLAPAVGALRLGLDFEYGHCFCAKAGPGEVGAGGNNAGDIDRLAVALRIGI